MNNSRAAAEEFGTNALIAALWNRGDLGLAAATFERRRSRLVGTCENLRRLGVPEEALAPILDLIKVPEQ